MMSALGEAKNGNVSSESRIACSRKGVFRAHNRRSVLGTLPDYVIGT